MGLKELKNHEKLLIDRVQVFFSMIEYFWSSIETSLVFHDFTSKTVLKPSYQKSWTVMCCACTLKENIKSCKYSWKNDNS